MRLPSFITILSLGMALTTTSCRVTPKSSVPIILPTTVPTTQGLEDPRFLESVDAEVAPPAGWVAQPLKQSSRHTHQIWLSPSGHTAYGVIHFGLPFPVGYEPVLWYFMKEMRKTQTGAELLSKQWDPNLHTMRFVAQGGLYTIRTNLTLRGFRGWAIYAGTLLAEPINQNELDLAERAREHTIVGADMPTEPAQSGN